MRWSQLCIPTLRESPADAEAVSHRLLLRAGFIRPHAPGVYHYLLLAQRSLEKIQRIIRQELGSIGAQEVRFAAPPAGLARAELRSHKQFPQIWFQFHTQSREEARPNAGFLRLRQFLALDGYTFDTGPAVLERLNSAFTRIFRRCGLDVRIAGTRYLVPAEAGEQLAAVCEATGYAAPLALAVSRPAPPAIPDPAGDLAPEPFHTPGQKTIAEIADFTGLPETSQMKSLVMVADGQPFLLMLRGDHQLSEAKFQAATAAARIRPAHASEIEKWFGASAGSLGPVGVLNLPILADTALRGRRNMISGANKDGYHLKNVTPGEDFSPAWHDLRLAAAGDTSLDSGDPLAIIKTIEVAHISPYPISPCLTVLSDSGHESPVIVHSCSIEIERLLCAAIELDNDPNGPRLPAAIAPFTVIITPINAADSAMRQAAETLYGQCQSAGLDPLFDDRDERPGVKFKDADLTGAPFRITIGKKLSDGIVEITTRRTGESRDVPLNEVIRFVTT